MTTFNSQHYNGRWEELNDFYKLNETNKLNRITSTSILNALTIGLVSGVLSLVLFLLKAGTIFGLDFHSLANVFSLAVVGAIVPFLQSLLVSPATGKFAGTLKVK
jgi:hypothetical protein